MLPPRRLLCSQRMNVFAARSLAVLDSIDSYISSPLSTVPASMGKPQGFIPKPGGRPRQAGKGGAGTKKAGKPKSVKNQIRSVQRLLKKVGAGGMRVGSTPGRLAPFHGPTHA